MFLTWGKGHTPVLGGTVLASILTINELYISAINSSTFQRLRWLRSSPYPMVRGPDSPHFAESLLGRRA